MKRLIISLNKKDINDIEYVLRDVAKAINDGFTSGIEYPVNWHIEKAKNYNNNIDSIQQQIRDLRDGDDTHICPCHENVDDPDGICTCYLFDKVIDNLENWKINE